MPSSNVVKDARANILLLLLSLAFGGLWIYAGWTKVWGLGPMQFLDSVRSFHLLGDPWAAWIAMGLPWLEILCGLGVVFGVCHRGALLLLIGSLLVFLGAIVSTWMRGIDIDCGCFGEGHGSHATHLSLVLRDLGLLAMGIVLWIFGERLHPWMKRHPSS